MTAAKSLCLLELRPEFISVGREGELHVVSPLNRNLGFAMSALDPVHHIDLRHVPAHVRVTGQTV